MFPLPSTPSENAEHWVQHPHVPCTWPRRGYSIPASCVDTRRRQQRAPCRSREDKLAPLWRFTLLVEAYGIHLHQGSTHHRAQFSAVSKVSASIITPSLLTQKTHLYVDGLYRRGLTTPKERGDKGVGWSNDGGKFAHACTTLSLGSKGRMEALVVPVTAAPSTNQY